MNAAAHTLKLALERGWLEFKINIKDPPTIIWLTIISIVFLTVLWFQRGTQLEGVSLALLTLPGLLGMQIANAGFSEVSSLLSSDREDGTLLRVKAIPRGMNAYFLARVVMTLFSILTSLAILAVPSIFIVPGLLENVRITDAFTFLALIVIGLFATAPFGAIIGSVVKSAASGWGLTVLPLALIVAISGIFYPITALAPWLQVLGQIFPVYWLGLGMRSIFLPDSAAALELAHSWRTPETFLVLIVWGIIGVIIVPKVLRRMARRVSGSEMEAARQRTMQRGY